jgi:integrase
MSNGFRVHVVDYSRKFFYMRYTDPITGKAVAKSTGERTRSKAERVAAKWEADLQEGRYKSPSKVTWDEFRERYETEVLAALADKTYLKVSGVFNAIEEHVNPVKLITLDAEQISRLQRALRDKGLAESTIKGHLAHLKAALNWAKGQKLISEVPVISMPKRAKGSKSKNPMKGRPITGEEFDRMLEKVPEVVEEKRATSWRHYLRGLWLSGLRLEESLELYWDRDDKLAVDVSGRRFMLRIPGELEKGNEDRLLPIAPEFEEFLAATPEAERTGRVFNPQARRRHGDSLHVFQVSNTVAEIGETAGVKVSTCARTGRIKYASAHDLRRSFGERWAQLVMPQLLMELMRHESIDTTMRYYVGRNAHKTADALWEAVKSRQSAENAEGNTSGNTITKSPEVQESEKPQPLLDSRLSE